MIPTADDGKYTRCVDVGDCFCDLTERLFDVPRDNENVAGIAEVEFLIEVNASVKPVTIIECGDTANCLRTKTCARPISRGGVKWCTDKCGFVLADLSNVLTIRRLHESVYAGECGLMTATE